MTFSVYQHWDPLKVCIVGRSYAPEFYSFINDSKVRTVFEQIAQETEEDYQKLIALLESFGVTVLRPNVSTDYKMYLDDSGKIIAPPMTPRDYSIMLGEEFFFKTYPTISEIWSTLRGADWPVDAPASMSELKTLPEFILKELEKFGIIDTLHNVLDMPELDQFTWGDVVDYVKSQGNQVPRRGNIHTNQFNSAMVTRIGRDVYVGTETYEEDITSKIRWLTDNYPGYRWHGVNTGGHSDGTYCPVKPGLIVSLRDIPTYQETFPGWEVVYLPKQSWTKVLPFLNLKKKNQGKWWVPGQELNDEFTNFVNQWMNHWVGYVEETVFDVNMLVIDEKNVVCNNYNEEVFAAFERHGITPHVVNFRHRYFWDGGLHCITSDVHRVGTMNNYFPERD
jgi:N-dimethylarginine dimethylaminohydrolase